MPEATTVESPPATPPAAETPAAEQPQNVDGNTLYAGKFKGPQALETAAREITTKLIADGVPLSPLPDGALFGNGAPFKDVMALEADYRAKEKLQGKLGGNKPAEKPPETPKPPPTELKIEDKAAKPAAPVADDDLDYAQIVEKAGLKLEDLEAQWEKNGGKLDDDAYAKLKAVGRGRKEVDSHARNAIVARAAVQREAVAKATEIAGGTDQLDTILQWAAGHYAANPKVKADLNARLKNPDQYEGAVRQMVAEYSQSVGSAGTRRLESGSGTTAPSGPITDAQEYAAILHKITSGTASKAEEARFAITPETTALRG